MNNNPNVFKNVKIDIKIKDALQRSWQCTTIQLDFNLAERFALRGWVLNNSAGVEIEVEGPAEDIAAFVAALRDEAPPLARVLYRGVKLDQEIPGSLYMAVAQLLAYVYQLRTARDSGTRWRDPVARMTRSKPSASSTGT